MSFKFLLVIGFVILAAHNACADEEVVRNLIKYDDNVSAQDQELNNTYDTLIGTLPSDKRKKLILEQRDWLKQRNSAIKSENDLGILLDMYSKRNDELSSQLRDEDEIPVSYILKHPEFIDSLNRRFAPHIIAKHHLYELPSFKKLAACLSNLESGRWVTTSYMTWAGSIYRDIDASTENFVDKMSYVPQLIEDKNSIKDDLTPLVAWSYQGIWNKKSYQECESLYAPAAREMAVYYKHNYKLSAYSKQSMKLLASYIYMRDSSKNSLISSSAFALFQKTNPDLADLKTSTNNFSKNDWNDALAMALLNHYTQAIIEWIITSGADVNTAVFDEYPLMRAVEQPDIIKLLLQKGANLEEKTPYGKTALFYAVQYNQLDSVKELVEAGADVNHKLDNLERFEGLGGDYLPEKIAEFTPLVYSLRYSSPEMTAYLKNKGAKLGTARLETIRKWVLENPLLKPSEIDQQLK